MRPYCLLLIFFDNKIYRKLNLVSSCLHRGREQSKYGLISDETPSCGNLRSKRIHNIYMKIMYKVIVINILTVANKL